MKALRKFMAKSIACPGSVDFDVCYDPGDIIEQNKFLVGDLLVWEADGRVGPDDAEIPVESALE